MEMGEFDIGAPFFTNTGAWVCTDKGTRTIVAIKVDEHDMSWLSGPPYFVAETVFDEHDIEGCWLDDAQAWESKAKEVNIETESPVPVEIALEAVHISQSEETAAYPYQRLLRWPRSREGKALYPVGARRKEGAWHIVVRSQGNEIIEVPEGLFRALPIVASAASRRIANSG